MRKRGVALSSKIFCRGGGLVKSLANRQLSTRAGSHAEKIFAGDETGGYRGLDGSQTEQNRQIVDANSPQKSMSNARKSMSNAR